MSNLAIKIQDFNMELKFTSGKENPAYFVSWNVAKTMDASLAEAAATTVAAKKL